MSLYILVIVIMSNNKHKIRHFVLKYLYKKKTKVINNINMLVSLIYKLI